MSLLEIYTRDSPHMHHRARSGPPPTRMRGAPRCALTQIRNRIETSRRPLSAPRALRGWQVLTFRHLNDTGPYTYALDPAAATVSMAPPPLPPRPSPVGNTIIQVIGDVHMHWHSPGTASTSQHQPRVPPLVVS